MVAAHIEELGKELDSMDRAEALDRLKQTSERDFPTDVRPGNMHAHTIFSSNPYGFTPARYALLARQYGMEVAGIVDFDVLDGLAEFHEAGRTLNLRTVVSLETRVYVPEFSTRVINSPGEPGIAYHMAAGFADLPTDAFARQFLTDLRARSERRTRSIAARVNAFLAPVSLDYDGDAVSLTPRGNVTERHLVTAYARKAAAKFAAGDLLKFWTDKLGPGLSAADLPESPKLLNLIRAKTMKQGGVGYVQPDASTFPHLAAFNHFALAAGAIPMLAWLDGTSDGEQAIEELCRVAAATGTAAVNIIPDRNFTPGVKDRKLQNLHDVVALADRLHWPVIAGTELNSPGQKFVDQFDAAELKPLVPAFQRGARILYAHTALRRAAGIGYLGPWADRHLPRREDRNAFFEDVGRRLDPRRESKLDGIGGAATPEDITRRLA